LERRSFFLYGSWGVLLIALGTTIQAEALASIPKEHSDLRSAPQQAVKSLRPLSTEEIEVLQSIEDLRARLAMRPDDPGLRGWRAWLYYLGMDYDSAIADMWFVLRDDPELLEARTFLAQVYLEKADVLYLKEEGSQRVWQLNELAIGELERVLAKTPGDQEATQLLAEAYNNKAYFLYLRRQDLPLALDLIDRAISLHAAQTFYLGTKAEVLYALGRSREALPHIRRALKDYPNEPELLKDLEMIRSSLSAQLR